MIRSVKIDTRTSGHTYTFGILRVVQHLLGILQPGLQPRHCATILLPIRDHLLQHAADAPHLQSEVLPLSCGIAEEFTHPLCFIYCEDNMEPVQIGCDCFALWLMVQCVRSEKSC